MSSSPQSGTRESWSFGRTDKPRVFISHSLDDSEFAARLAEDMDSRGYSFLASPHWEYPAKFREVIANADAHVLVLSPAYLRTSVAELDHILALDRGRGMTVVPLLASPVEVPSTLADHGIIDFTNPDRYHDALAELTGVLETLTGSYPAEVPGEGEQTEAPGKEPPSEVPPPPEALPLAKLQEFPFSAGAERVVQEAVKLAGAHPDGVVRAEDLLFGAAERGLRENGGSCALLWELISSADGRAYREALRGGFARFNGGDASHVSPDTVEVIRGAQQIAGWVSRSDRIRSRHLITALFLVRPTSPHGMRPAEFAARMGVPYVEASFLSAVQSAMLEDDVDAWRALCARKWTASELTAERERAAPALPVRSTSVSDAPAREDSLGFAPYVQALAHFLTHRNTVPPLTLSVEGEWGSGKSSFMLQLESEIRSLEDGGETRAAGTGWWRWLPPALRPFREPGAVTVWFNPWRHDKEEALWAAFALQFVDGVKGCMPWGWRFAGNLRMFATRFRWQEGWRDVVRLILILLAFVVLATVVIRAGNGWSGLVSRVGRIGSSGDSQGQRELLDLLLKSGGVLAAAAAAMSLFKEMSKLVGDPLRIDLRRYARAPDYEQRMSFIEQFHRDFGKVLDAYAGKRRVYVFVDDLDRCQVPRAADLMQALNLMVGDDRRVVFVIGMDREKVAASLAVKFKDLIPFVGNNPWNSSDPATQAVRAMEFGSDYIEKFVQIAFRVPQPSDANIDALLTKLSRDAQGARPGPVAARAQTRAEEPASVRGPAPERSRPTGDAPPRTGQAPPVTPKAEDAPRRATMQVSVDSEQVQRIVRTLAPALELNPRRLKQFINIFRLQAYIAARNGRIAEAPGQPGLTLEQLGKLVALGMRWPVLLGHVEADPVLLGRLQKVALGNTIAELGREEFWASRPELLCLLRAGLTDPKQGEAQRQAHTLEGVDLTILSQVAAVGATSRRAES